MSDVENFNVNMNLVGFGLDATEKFTKQIDTINRMNAAQDRLKYVWGIGKQIQNCQVHFVISSPLPAYLENTADPVLTNQNIETDNIIPCPFPVTTFDLMDILAYVESLIPESRVQSNRTNTTQAEAHEIETDNQQDTPVDFSSMSLYERARLGLNNKLSQIEATSPASTSNTEEANLNTGNRTDFTFKSYQATPQPTEAPKKDTFTTYGSFSMEGSVHKNTSSEPSVEATEKPVVSSWTNTYTNTSKKTESIEPPSSTPAPTTEVKQHKTETFIRYGSLKNNVADELVSQTPSVSDEIKTTTTPTNAEAPTPNVDTTTAEENTDLSVQASSEEKNHTASKQSSTSEAASYTDIWLDFLAYQQSLIHVKEPEFYCDAEQKNISSNYKNASELAQGMIKQTEIVSDTVNNIPNDLKKLPLSAVLWSYGLHHPHAEQLLQAMDIENHEWKLKGFPRFGLWETHPTWLFLATFFAQKHQSIFAAQAKGKADATQIINFICAAKLAGLTWDSRPLATELKQQQIAEVSEQPHKESASWISRLRSKLHINEHFES